MNGRDPTTSSRPPALTPRLRAVADLVPPDARVVDVGSGHGRLPVALLAGGLARSCIAVERSASAAAPLLPLAGRPGLVVRIGDGLTALQAEDEADVLVMSGLGTRAMLRILASASGAGHDWRRLVLQPQTERARLRRWLVEHGFSIVAESLTHDRGRYYVTLAAEPREHAAPTPHPGLEFDDLMEAGPCLVASGSPAVARYWSEVLERSERILRRGASGSGGRRAERARAIARRVLSVLTRPLI